MRDAILLTVENTIYFEVSSTYHHRENRTREGVVVQKGLRVPILRKHSWSSKDGIVDV